MKALKWIKTVTEESDVTRAKSVYPAIKHYVSYVRTLPPEARCYGLCFGLSRYSDLKVSTVQLRKLLDAYVSSEPKATPECVTLPAHGHDVPFNCICGNCEVPSYTHETATIDSGKARLANPYRRAFINWVCRLADKPELLP